MPALRNVEDTSAEAARAHALLEGQGVFGRVLCDEIKHEWINCGNRQVDRCSACSLTHQSPSATVAR